MDHLSVLQCIKCILQFSQSLWEVVLEDHTKPVGCFHSMRDRRMPEACNAQIQGHTVRDHPMIDNLIAYGVMEEVNHLVAQSL